MQEDGSHRNPVAAIRRTAANTWLTFGGNGPLAGQTIRYSNRASVLVERAATPAAKLAGHPTSTGAVRQLGGTWARNL